MTAETNWPPRWGGKRQDLQAYQQIFDGHFLRKFRKKALEWDTPEKDRIYCRQTDPPRRPQECGTFLARLLDRQKCQQCKKYKWYTCLRCLGCFSSSDVEGKTTAIDHECDPSAEHELRERAFDGLKRGWHYQDCPNPSCQKRVELAEACRHVVCLCGTEFCFLCGAVATKRSGHWNRAMGSNCPLYPSGLFADDDEPAEHLDPDGEVQEQWQLEMLWEQQALEADRYHGEEQSSQRPHGPRERERRHADEQRLRRSQQLTYTSERTPDNTRRVQRQDRAGRPGPVLQGHDFSGSWSHGHNGDEEEDIAAK
ncbi:hypothetical protein LTR36_004470 [Oleoguttula mirabilis]|uniref:IBR domain-containing protein n=1 Tax=Oleoguttula mirabilis TaxID=1507867 RepID=A0AAV9JHE9_9PEZI|nr:hypothetical protein LTR36_004470 [Oleoguttula mirabilis]